MGVARRRRRIVWWIVALAAVSLLGLAGFASLHVYQNRGPFHVGSCFRVGKETGISTVGGLREVQGRGYPVSCATAHDAEITRAVDQSSDCSPEGAWLVSRSQTYCVILGPIAGTS